MSTTTNTQGRLGIQGDLVQGDKVGGDKVMGDKITTGDITGSMGVAIGRGARATVTQGVSGDDLARLFQVVYQRIDARPADPNVDKPELIETAQKIEQEAKQGEAANPVKVERWLRTLAEMAGDIFDVVAACLVNPAAGVGAVIRKVVERVKRDRQG